MIEDLTTLDGITSGEYVVFTERGTAYQIDLGRRTAIRRSGVPPLQWDFVGVSMGGPIPDGIQFRYDTITGATVGKKMELANAIEWRLTAEVAAIRPADGRYTPKGAFTNKGAT